MWYEVKPQIERRTDLIRLFVRTFQVLNVGNGNGCYIDEARSLPIDYPHQEHSAVKPPTFRKRKTVSFLKEVLATNKNHLNYLLVIQPSNFATFCTQSASVNFSSYKTFERKNESYSKRTVLFLQFSTDIKFIVSHHRWAVKHYSIYSRSHKSN